MMVKVRVRGKGIHYVKDCTHKGRSTQLCACVYVLCACWWGWGGGGGWCGGAERFISPVHQNSGDSHRHQRLKDVSTTQARQEDSASL